MKWHPLLTARSMTGAYATSSIVALSRTVKLDTAPAATRCNLSSALPPAAQLSVGGNIADALGTAATTKRQRKTEALTVPIAYLGASWADVRSLAAGVISTVNA